MAQGWTRVAEPTEQPKGWSRVEEPSRAEKSRRAVLPKGPIVPSSEIKRVDRMATPQEIAEMEMGAQSGVVDFAIGAGKRFLESVGTAGQILRKVPGVSAADKVMPPVRVNTERTNPMQQTGAAIEQATEFAAPLARVSKATAAMSLPARAAAEGAAGAGVAAFQSKGDPTATVSGGVLSALGPVAFAGGRAAFGAAQRAAAGAKDGGLGGALAGAIRSAAPAEPAAMLTQALKPRNSRIYFSDALERGLPEIKAAEATMGAPINTIDDLIAATKVAKRNLQQQLDTMRGPMNEMGATVDLSAVADATVASIPNRTRLLAGRQATRLERQADAFRRPFTLEEAETLLQETNAQLDGFYAQFPSGQRRMLAGNPGIATLEAQAKALRDAIYRRLDDAGQGEAARELNRRYGSLMEIEGEALRRSNVAKRQQPESLSEQIGAVRAAADMARGAWKVTRGDISGAADMAAAAAGRSAAKSIKESQTTDALIRRAFAGYAGKPKPVAMPQKPPIRGLLGRGPIVTPPPADRSGIVPLAERDYVMDPAMMRTAGGPKQLPPHMEPPAARPPIVTPPPDGSVPAPSAAPVDRSGVRSVPAAPLAYDIDPYVPVKAGGVRVSQFSGDPDAARAAIATPEVREMLERMRDDLIDLPPHRGRLVRDANDRNSSVYAYGGPGSPVGDDVRTISEQNVGNKAIKFAIQDLLDGKMPSNRLHTAALDAAMGYLEKRSGYRGPALPARYRVEDADDGFEAFSRAVDELAD